MCQGGKIAILISLFRKGPPEKGTFDSEGSEGACHAMGRSVLEGGNNKQKDPNEESVL